MRAVACARHALGWNAHLRRIGRPRPRQPGTLRVLGLRRAGGGGGPARRSGSTAARSAPRVDQELVDRYTPILRLRAQEDPPCDTTEEQYQPTSVDTVLGNPRVQLVLVRNRKKRVIK